MRALDPVSVIESLDQYANHGDLINAMKLFADDAVLKIEPEPPPPLRSEYHGRQEIEEFERELLQGRLRVESTGFDVAGNEVTWRSRLWADDFRRMGIEPAEAVAHAVLWGALIKQMELKFSPQTAQKMQAAKAAQQQPHR